MMAISMRGYASLMPVLPANGWKVTEHTDDKILKLPAFLRGRAACNFYAIPEGETDVRRCRKIDATSPISTSEARKFLRRV